jgi:hypothetical protein
MCIGLHIKRKQQKKLLGFQFGEAGPKLAHWMGWAGGKDDYPAALPPREEEF